MTDNKAKIITCLALTIFLSAGASLQVRAQEEDAPAAKAPAGGAQATGPIDITADEQEFAADSVIARGKVRVVYKDSVIIAPLATLYKDESGNPNRAVFTGHPRLTQARNRMDANMLTFEMQKQKVIAVGNAHSEVDIPDDQKDNSLSAGKKPQTKLPPPPVVSQKPARVDKNDSDDDDDRAPAAPVVAGGSDGSGKGAPAKDKPAEKIITDSERQEFDQESGKFEAFGHVKLVNGEMIVFADKMQVVYGAASNKPETCLFTGHVIATQGKNSTCADNISYSLTTKRLQASGNVKSKVIQEKKEDTKKKGFTPIASADVFGAPACAASKTQLSASASANAIAMPVEANDKPVWVFSDAQDYNRDGGRVAAQGNVKVVNGDMYGCGPSVVLTRKADGKADKVYFVGRSQISQPGRRWVADEITYVVDDKRVVASGNARAMVIQSPNDKKQKHKVVPAEPAPTRLAEPPGKRSLSASKIEAPK